MRTYTINAKTPKGQANQVLRAIQREAERTGADSAYAFVKRYDEHHGGACTAVGKSHASYCTGCSKGAWTVCWEDGPYEWGVIAGGGGNIWGEELGYTLYDRRLAPTFEFASHVKFDHYWTFDFCFFPYQ